MQKYFSKEIENVKDPEKKEKLSEIYLLLFEKYAKKIRNVNYLHLHYILT